MNWKGFLAPVVVTLLLTRLTIGAAAPGVVAGWDSRDGRLLVGELGCASCHAAGNSAGHLTQKQAPNLARVGTRVTPQYLRKFLAEPHQVKPGTPMPDLLHGLEPRRRAATVEALVHYLASLGGPIDQRSSGASLGQIEQGRNLYHSVGCVACHQPVEVAPKHKIDPAAAQAKQELQDAAGKDGGDKDAADKDGGDKGGAKKPSSHPSIPLGELASKTTVDALAAFLDDPLASRPSGRMPGMNLRRGEARMLAAYLLRDQYSESLTAPGVGLDVAYYRGSWPKVPDFEKLTPVWEGEAKSFDLGAIRIEGGEQPGSNFAFRFHGLIDVPRDGEYRFWTRSDDGSILLIDGKRIVDNDGTHGPQEREGRVTLTKGRHALEVGFAQGGGGFELSVAWQPPGGQRGPIPPGVLFHSAAAMIPKGIADFRVDPTKAAEGQKLFAGVGCANCHSVKAGQPVAGNPQVVKGPELSKLAAGAGCLAEQVKPGVPKFALSAAQRGAVKKALAALSTGPAELAPQARIAQTMSAMNCYRCHARDGRGGPDEKTADYFTYETLVDLGDEGRLAPPLDHVGAKLTAAGFEDMLVAGQRYRTYMATRMPQYGKANVGHVPALFTAADAGRIPAHKPRFSSRMVDDGRRLIGKQMLSCINCHAWGPHRLPGAEGMDLLQVTRRLQPAWFQAWLVDPQKLRPGTRMPTAWPEGNSFFPNIQGGDTQKQIDAVWAYLAAGTKGGMPPGLSPDDNSLLVPVDEPIVFRTFFDAVSAHAILVGFRQRTHVAFDANRIKMAVAWTGDFVSTKPAWDGRAGQYAKPAGSEVVRLPDGPPLARLESLTTAWPKDIPKANLGSNRAPPGWKFRGYRFDEQRVPTFMYRVGSIDVEETPSTDFRPRASYLSRRFHFTSPGEVNNFYLRLAVGKQIEEQDGQYSIDGRLHYRVKSTPTVKPLVREVEGQRELVVPVEFAANGKQQTAEVHVEMTW